MEGIMKSCIIGALTVCLLPLTPVRLLAAMGVDKKVLSTREIYEEADAEYEEACSSMGSITIEYAGKETGRPDMGFRIIDPRGREIGYDPRTSRGWQELPLAQAFLDCEENEDTGELRQCKGHVEICGPVSGSYQIEFLPTHSGKHLINVSATSQRMRTEFGSDTTSSRADLNSEMHKQEPAELLLQYSRELGTQVLLTVSNQRLADRNNHHNRDSARVNRSSKGDVSAHR
jgi:hypothetical protein